MVATKLKCPIDMHASYLYVAMKGKKFMLNKKAM